MKQRDYVILENALVMWASTTEPNKRSGKYQMDLCALSPKEVEALAKLGIKARTRPDDKEKGHFITVKSKMPMKILDEDGQPLAEDVRIANGSRMKAMITSYEWSGQYGKGVSPSLAKAKLTLLKEFIEDIGFDDDDDFAVKGGKSLAEMKDDVPF